MNCELDDRLVICMSVNCIVRNQTERRRELEFMMKPRWIGSLFKLVSH